VPEVLLGIDSGQTVGKVGLYDLAGRELASAAAPTAVSRPQPGWAERDMEGFWEQITLAIRSILAAAGPRVSVLGVGICGHNDGAYPVDGSLRPVRPAILATDSRADASTALNGHPENAERALELTGEEPYAGSPATLYAWLRDHEPDRFAAIRWVLFCKDWIRLRLTGSVATDPTDAGASFLGVGGQWSDEALELYGLTALRPALPPLLPSPAVAGEVTGDAAAATGLPAGTPVVTGCHDVDANALGVGAVGVGSASAVMGTFSINQVVTDRAVVDPRWKARAFLEPGRWLHMSTSPAGAINLDWAIRRLGPLTAAGEPDPASAIAEAMMVDDESRLPLFLPFLFGSPHPGSSGAAWTGMRGWHERPHLLNAVLEGVAFNHRTHLGGLREEFPIAGPVRVTGGGARSADWTQLLADVLDLPVQVTDAAEAGTRGAALLAGLGTGAYADLEDAAQAAVRVTRTQHPRPARVAHRAARYEGYRAEISRSQRSG
jgi:L-xylulokinase